MERTKERKVSYQRLTDKEASVALALAIIKLHPVKGSYRASNYILTYNDYNGDDRVVITLTDDKDRMICVIDHTRRVFDCNTRIDPSRARDEVITDAHFTRTKSALRQLLPAIVFQDFTAMKAPVVEIISA